MEKYVQIIGEYSNGRCLVVWGSGTFSKEVTDELAFYQIYTDYYVKIGLDSYFNDIQTIELQNLQGKADDYYIVITGDIPQAVECLQKFGYGVNDYYIIKNDLISVELSKLEDIGDNRICCDKYDHLQLLLRGSANDIFIESGVVIGKNVRIEAHNGGIIHIKRGVSIGDNSVLLAFEESQLIIEQNVQIASGADITSRYQSEIVIENNARIDKDAAIFVKYSSILRIGERSTFCFGLNIINVFHSNIIIGMNCMVSHRVSIICNDGHPIYDVYSGEIVNSGKAICIEDNVWLGANSTVMSESRIGTGSILAAQSLLKNRTIPSFCSSGGIPAKVLRQGISWSRSLSTWAIERKKRGLYHARPK